MTKLRLGILGIGFASIALAISVQAKEVCTETKLDLVASQTSVLNNHKYVAIRFETHSEMSGVCDLTLYSFAYEPQNESISIVAQSEEPCLNESYGKRKGATIWRVPEAIIRKSGSLTIFINGEKAGMLTIKDGEALLIPENLTL